MSEDQAVEVLCPQCGDLLRIADPKLVLLAQHLILFCSQTAGVTHEVSSD